MYIQKVHSTLKEYRKLFLKEWSYWCPRGGNKKTVLASLLWKPWSDRSKKVLFVLPWMFKLHLNSSVSDVNDGAGYTKDTRRQDKTLSLAPLTGLQHHSLGQDFIWWNIFGHWWWQVIIHCTGGSHRCPLWSLHHSTARCRTSSSDGTNGAHRQQDITAV